MRSLHLHLSASSGPRALGKLLLPLLMAQLWVSEAQLPGNDTGFDRAVSPGLCPRGSQPWQVALFNGLKFHCAGVLVAPSWVLTAAHCWNNKKLWARVGDDHLLLLQGEQLRLTTEAFIHPKYHQGSGPILPRRTDEHDIMLLKLGRPVVLGPRAQTLRLPFSCTTLRDNCHVAGWGTTSSRRVKYNRSLSCSRVTLLSLRECEVFYPGVLTNNMICAGLDEGQDPCQSDSGGPLVCDETLQGILSWGVYPCGSVQHPAVYTQICKYTNWIQRIIRSN
ncbi:kallikrein-10 [Octodon degus]|uniref:Kallikrein-10 n=1 Tax=Octodon degus TaxID=10160 RepID=A0A6P3FSX4_OCTDE|nr:kallikrein-10 [Octodon degus]XP_023560638.1 kallikrein-10 [Octodon degus]XP_023560639.1 kallikrein-10 [Octodon degus]XP_023560640.1 kallikrein-10 [Octodon degus]